ncbi:hypothetical protein SS50377_27518 [Spironucleus salmonicida]|uniref:Uncharacterized protein n=1 Tax=Spironucleus salmonicida TaxID=348837 RepID=V6M143_9EUKA|nr:hypothetical protein SS50377_27518 [Spironucleus salmonicida]|eukprot:EST46889.1 hypothetical protein SS50377_13042 [Spironucleus salmonicida]
MTESEKLQLYAQTIIEGGSIMQSQIGYFFDDSNLDKPQLASAKQMSVEIYNFDGGNELILSKTIYLNKSIDQIQVLKGGNTYSKNDLLLIITSYYELFLIQFTGTSENCNYQIIKNFELMVILAQDKRVQIPFQKKASPYIDQCQISQNVQLVCFTLQESNNIQNQLFFVCFEFSKGSININLGFGNFKKQTNGLITQVSFSEPLDRQVDGFYMNPILLIHQQYNNRFYTYEILPCSLINKFEPGVNYINEGIYIDEGPFTVQNLSDYSLTKPINQIDFFSKVRPQNWILFPIITIAFDRIIVYYNIRQSEALLIGHLSKQPQKFRTLNALSRPLTLRQISYPKQGRHFYFISTFDDGSLVHIDIDFNLEKPVLTAQTLEWPVIQNGLVRLPTSTSLTLIPWYNQKQHRVLVYLGSQSIDTCILELLGTKSPTLQRFNDRFQTVLGAIQDFCICSDGRMFLCTSHGRDGSIINLRFGYSLKSLNQLKIEEVFKKDTIHSFVYNKQIFINIQSKTGNILYQYHKQIDDVCQLFKVPEFHELSYAIKQPSIFVGSIFNKIVLVTTQQLFVDKNSYLITAQKAIQVQNDIYLINKNEISIFDVVNKLQIIQIIKLDFIIIAIQSIQLQQHHYVFAFLERNQLAILLKTGQILNLQKIYKFDIEFDSVGYLQIQQHHYLLFSSNQFVIKFDIEIVQDQFNIKMETMETISMRSSKCYIYTQEKQLFLKSESSLYFIDVLNNDIHFVPLLTQPLTIIPKICFLPEQILDDVGIYCNDDQCFLSSRHSIINYPQIGQTSQKLFLKYMVVIITDQMLINNKETPVYQVMYSDDDDCNHNYYLNICKINVNPSYATQRSLIKRSTIKIKRYQQHNCLVVLSEQYLGKMQLRIFDQNSRNELHKLILDSSVCVNMEFANIGGITYFLFARYSVLDIHQHFLHQQMQITKHEPQIDVTVIQPNKTVIKVGIFKFDSDTPCLSISIYQNFLYCAIGSDLIRYTLSTTPSADQETVKVGTSNLALYFTKTAQLSFTESTIENIIISDRIYFIKSGMLMIANLDLLEYQEFINHSDLKLITPFHNGCIIIDHTNIVKYISNDGVQIATLQLAQNASTIKSFKDRVILGTDTGGIIVIVLKNGLFLQFLQNEISQAYEQLSQNLFITNGVDSVDGDIIKKFTKLNSSEQESLSIRLNVTRESILKMLKDIDISITD